MMQATTSRQTANASAVPTWQINAANSQAPAQATPPALPADQSTRRNPLGRLAAWVACSRAVSQAPAQPTGSQGQNGALQDLTHGPARQHAKRSIAAARASCDQNKTNLPCGKTPLGSLGGQAFSRGPDAHGRHCLTT